MRRLRLVLFLVAPCAPLTSICVYAGRSGCVLVADGSRAPAVALLGNRREPGGAELGAAWRQESKDGETPYLAVKLDDPSFAGPMRAAFFENEKDGTGVMVWKR